MAKKNENVLNLVDTFQEFKELKNIDRATMINVLEESFRNAIAKMFGSDKNYDVIGYKEDKTRDAAYQVDRITKEMLKGKYKNMSDSLVAVNLKLLIHMVGDMHCPSHACYTKDFGYKGHSIYIKGKKIGRHKFWDAGPQYMHPKWKADDYLKACDTYSPKQIKKISKGNVYKWSVDNAKREVVMFDFWERHEELTKMSKERRERINDLMYQQLAYAGYRLAATLNRLFAK